MQNRQERDTLVFSVGLLTAASDHLWLLPRIFLVFSWLCLAISILTGVMVRSQIPVKLNKKNYKIDDRIFNIEGQVHAGSFVLGVVTLGLALLFTLIKIPIEQVAAVDSAREALDRAKTELTPDEHARLSRLDVIEEIKGGDGNALPDGIWHIRFSLGSQGSKIRSNNSTNASTIDVIVPISLEARSLFAEFHELIYAALLFRRFRGAIRHNILRR